MTSRTGVYSVFEVDMSGEPTDKMIGYLYYTGPDQDICHNTPARLMQLNLPYNATIANIVKLKNISMERTQTAAAVADKGILLIAIGSTEYLRMAENLARFGTISRKRIPVPLAVGGIGAAVAGRLTTSA